MTTHPLHDAEDQLELGQPAPPFNLPNVDGRRVALDDFKGKVKALAVIFSCNHCPYVIKTEDRMISLAREFKSRGVEFVLISVNDTVKYPQDAPPEMAQRARAKGYPFPYLFNEDQETARAYGAKVTPHIFLFDGELKLRYRGALDDNMDLEKRLTKQFLREALEAILAGKSVPVGKTRAVGCSVKWK